MTRVPFSPRGQPPGPPPAEGLKTSPPPGDECPPLSQGRSPQNQQSNRPLQRTAAPRNNPPSSLARSPRPVPPYPTPGRHPRTRPAKPSQAGNVWLRKKGADPAPSSPAPPFQEPTSNAEDHVKTGGSRGRPAITKPHLSAPPGLPSAPRRPSGPRTRLEVCPSLPIASGPEHKLVKGPARGFETVSANTPEKVCKGLRATRQEKLKGFRPRP